METVAAALRWARETLARSPLGIAPREASTLLEAVLGATPAALLAHPERTLSAAESGRYAALVARRAAGEPYAYLVGEREFWGRAFAVDPRVLIPRPETEHLVEAVLAQPLPARPLLLDVGVGSGAIAVTLACEIADARVVAVDVSPGALAVARRNAARHGVADRVLLAGSDLASALDLARFDLVAANLPYVPAVDAPTLSPEVRDHEPPGALFSGADGLDAVRALLVAAGRLRPGTPLVLELGLGQPAALTAILPPTFVLAATISDYAGIARIVVGKRTAARSADDRGAPGAPA